MITAPTHAVFLLDADNTLLDNDWVINDLRWHLVSEFGAASAGRYWEIFEALRGDLGYADYLGALQRYRLEAERAGGDEPRLLKMSTFLVDYPFAKTLYPRALDVIVLNRRQRQRSGWCGALKVHIAHAGLAGFPVFRAETGSRVGRRGRAPAGDSRSVGAGRGRRTTGEKQGRGGRGSGEDGKAHDSGIIAWRTGPAARGK